jgi:putative endonuclease
MNQGRFFVYILASRSRILYTGVTRDLLRRVHQHRKAEVPGFSRKYQVNRLVYFEETSSAISEASFDRQCECRVARSGRGLVSQDLGLAEQEDLIPSDRSERGIYLGRNEYFRLDPSVPSG